MRASTFSIITAMTLLCGACATPPEPPPPVVQDQPPVRSQNPPKPEEADFDLAEVVNEAAVQLVAKSYPELREKDAVVVMPCESASGGTTILGYLLADMLTEGLMNKAGCRVVDRSNIDEVLLEKYGYADLMDLDRMTEVGKATQARYITTCKIYTAPEKMPVALKLLAVANHENTSMHTFEIPKTSDIRSTLRFVQWPEQGSGELPPLNLDFGFQLIKSGEWLKERSVVHSNDQFRLILNADSDCYAYVLLRGSSGKARPVFPHHNLNMSNLLKGGTRYTIPWDEQYYFFDETPGLEEFFIFATYHKQDLFRLTRELQETGEVTADAIGAVTKELWSDTRNNGDAQIREKGRAFTVTGSKDVRVGGWTNSEPRTDQRHSPPPHTASGFASVVYKFTIKHVK